MSSSAALNIVTATDLVQAWLADLARDHGRAVLFLKGRSASFHGLRPERVSSDVDVLVPPDDFQHWQEILSANGWKKRPATVGQDLFVTHSASYLHPSWPCDVDIHQSFPGFLAEPATTFRMLWCRRDTMTVAGIASPIPDKLSTLAVVALHALRSRDEEGRHFRELSYLFDHADLTTNEREELGRLAMDTGCDRTLALVLSRLDVPRTEGVPVGSEKDLQEWRLRVASGASTGYMWWLILRRQGGWARLRLLGAAMWPSRADLLHMRPGLRDTHLGRVRARIDRLRRGLPGAYTALHLRLRRPRGRPPRLRDSRDPLNRLPALPVAVDGRAGRGVRESQPPESAG